MKTTEANGGIGSGGHAGGLLWEDPDMKVLLKEGVMRNTRQDALHSFNHSFSIGKVTVSQAYIISRGSLCGLGPDSSLTSKKIWPTPWGAKIASMALPKS